MNRKIATVILFIFLCGCSRSSFPEEIIQSKADIEEAEELLYKAWKPAYDMTIDGITILRCKVKNFDEFLTMYDFSYVSEELGFLMLFMKREYIVMSSVIGMILF